MTNERSDALVAMGLDLLRFTREYNATDDVLNVTRKTRCARCRDLIADEAAAEIVANPADLNDDKHVLVHADTCLRADDVLA